MKIATKASRKLPVVNARIKKPMAKNCPTVEATFVALTAPMRVASRPRRMRPPSIGKAGSRLKTASATFIKPR